MSRIDYPKIYNPAYQSADELIHNFVVRTKLFAYIYNDISDSAMKFPEMHYIIQGIRGQGKTTLLLRIAYEIRKNTKLRKRLIPVIFNEEQYHITRLYKLWESVAEYLGEYNEIPGLYNEMRSIKQDDDYERHCFELLEGRLKKQQKKIILFIDNIDELFNKFSTREIQRLREVLIESAEIRLIGASAVGLEFHHDYGQSFYQFFRIEELKGLTPGETTTLLLKLGEHYHNDRVQQIVKNESGRVEALRRLTGGVIRTIVLLFEIFVDDIKGNAFRDLEKILDLVTPLYKHRMEKLSVQQQEIVDCIALAWDAVGAKEIAEKTRIESKAVSSQLNQLVKYHIVEIEKTETKNHLYRVQERFFNIWYLMRHGRKWDEKRVRFFVEFLQAWCNEDDLIHIARRHMTAVKQGNVYDREVLYITEALAQTPIKRRLQHELITTAKSYLESCDSELVAYVSDSDQELAQQAIFAFINGKIEKATVSLEKIKNKSAADLNSLGRCYMAERKIKQAEEYFLMAVEKGAAEAMYNLGLLYETELKKFSKAEQYYLMAAETSHVKAMYNLGRLYHTEFKDFSRAEQYYLMAVEKNDTNAMVNLGVLYHNEFKDFSKAEQCYLMAVEKNATEAMFNLGLLFDIELMDSVKAEKYYLMAAELGHFNAMNNLAWLYFSRKTDKTKALDYTAQSFQKEKTLFNSHTYATILLWNNEILKAYELSKEFLSRTEFIDEIQEETKLFLLLLLAKKQYQLTYKLFTEYSRQLKDRFKPIYFALMYFMQPQYPNEYRKMGSEFKETVAEIISKIAGMEKDYA